ncbi:MULTISPECIES: thermonuclease family protein [Bradyrhizobium]|jgi:hypothetical protein|uniref:Nuclease n=1 Tax=Bradyrhizobium elkanii TaxID=29448 RepID=A0A8I2BX60_BRAEL|nr:hypothetical protein [Bradyrhizobium elkanii]MCS4007604.1 hypothetical protein [Bradyrhizobium elkanii USDA 61]MBP1290615.1 hypothetical protein [Bradyrhizobium elkanii]MCP1755414.1 hypothetical protein [Bradyrhizobium elkanii]MCP1929075.1 hypothetical protein [Bradyrhizobium elkanii]MCP1972379.1 hypothetical protein [Bradyrhizobium elkanii]
MIERLGLLLLLVLLSGGAVADNFVGQASVVDGDTLEIYGTRIRLWGVDAPESSQLCRGEDSLQFVAARRRRMISTATSAGVRSTMFLSTWINMDALLPRVRSAALISANGSCATV